MRAAIASLLCLLLQAACVPAVRPVFDPAGTGAPPPAQLIPTPVIAVAAEGLLGPIGLAALPDGTLLVAEAGTGRYDQSAGISLIKPDGRVGRLLSGLYSSRDAGDLAGAALVGVSPAGDAIYVGNFGAGHLWMLPLNEEQQTRGVDIPPEPLSAQDMVPLMLPLAHAQLANPFDVAFDPAGLPVVTDASANRVATLNAGGAIQVLHRFQPLSNPDPGHPWRQIEAVPTGIARIGAEYFVTLTGGCPFPAGGGKLVAIEGAQWRTVAGGLTMPIDVAQAADGTIWVLEFARFAPDAVCFLGNGYVANSGRLSRLLPDGRLEQVLAGLNYPAAVLPMPDGTLYVSEVFPGRILHITLAQ